MSNSSSRSDKTGLYYLAFSHFQKIGPTNWRYLENYFPNLEAAWLATRSELEAAGLKPKLAEEFIKWRSSCNPEKIIQGLVAQKINYITWHDPDYPAILREIPAPPPVLYYLGDLNGKNKNRLAVVGTRQPSPYADKVLSELLPPVIRAGLEIVSGLALGVDALAHRAALKENGTTIAVLGSGLAPQSIYPSANRRLAKEIIQNGGAIISEFPPNTPPYKQNFPQRNRIISGLSQATLIIEARARSGALITARFALEQNREVLAIPGNIFSELSTGPNNLIQAGAKTVTRASDILETYNIAFTGSAENSKKSPNYSPSNPVEALVYNLIKQASARAEKITTNEIIEKSRLDTATINSTLSILEIAGIAKNTESGYDLN